MKFLVLLFLVLGLVSCNRTTPPEQFQRQHTITGVVTGITNCYQKDNVLTWYSRNTNADLQVSGRSQDGYPKCLVTTQINQYERIEIWLMKYEIEEIHVGKTEYKTLDFLHVEDWDDRVMAKKFWPWPRHLRFFIDTKDYRIVTIEGSPQKPKEDGKK